MTIPPANRYSVTPEIQGQTLTAALRQWLPGQSWSGLRRLVSSRRIQIDGELCLDPARRLREGQVIELLVQSAAPPRRHAALNIRHLDGHVVVVEKPTGISTVRHPTERQWTAPRKALHPTLEDLLPPLIAASPERQRRDRRHKGPLPRLRVVHRIDKGTSGLVVFARTIAAESGLGRQFRDHTVLRRYLAVVPGMVAAQRIATRLVRDRGDGRRGSVAPTLNDTGSKEAITHVEVMERLPGYTLLACRLETGRTHQIRIHLAELGHPVCGEKVYNRKPNGDIIADKSGALRLALHAAELGFVHPVTGEELRWEMALPEDLSGWLDRLRQKR